ncbi:SDR family oxidoreductase [Holophaga foetida]|uniref:SDR family oxidoreductase n=1 Tax=Holophaga foetida TaxID=35839 RepID=UPI00024749D5|nr:SDR family NAD(P)-dependent oxidoreductase [Holophaga foetida]
MLCDSPIALIAGAGPGIGRATASRFAAEGFQVAVLARPDTAEALQEEIHGPSSLILGVDVADRRALGEALARVEAELGFPEVLVWNASHGHPGCITQVEDVALLGDLEANLLAPLDAVRWALPAMRSAARGSILITGGGLGLDPKPPMASSSLGKALQRHLALLLDGELREAGIHAATLTVCGFVQPGTPLSPDAVAGALWDLHAQEMGSWERERLLRG